MKSGKLSAIADFNSQIRVFFAALDVVYELWRRQSHGDESHESQARALHAKERIEELAPSIVADVVPLRGETAQQFVAGILHDVKNAWHLCRFVNSIGPKDEVSEPDLQRVQEEMHRRLPALRNSLWEAWQHIGSTLQLAQPVADGATETKPKRLGRRKADYFTVQREAQLAADWARARDSKVYKPDFAKDQKMTLKEFDRLLDRVAYRKRLSE